VDLRTHTPTPHPELDRKPSWSGRARLGNESQREGANVVICQMPERLPLLVHRAGSSGAIGLAYRIEKDRSNARHLPLHLLNRACWFNNTHVMRLPMVAVAPGSRLCTGRLSSRSAYLRLPGRGEQMISQVLQCLCTVCLAAWRDGGEPAATTCMRAGTGRGESM